MIRLVLAASSYLGVHVAPQYCFGPIERGARSSCSTVRSTTISALSCRTSTSRNNILTNSGARSLEQDPVFHDHRNSNSTDYFEFLPRCVLLSELIGHPCALRLSTVCRRVSLVRFHIISFRLRLLLGVAGPYFEHDTLKFISRIFPNPECRVSDTL